MNDAPVKSNISTEVLIGQVADEFLRRQEAGERPEVEEYAARHPEAAELIRKVLMSLLALNASLARGVLHSSDDGMEGTLGDFRLIREVGRGGMGVVYEAEQISLRRQVALKVLPFAATMDPRQLQRFHNEARAAASLHHEHIVPVFAVGCERGVHYYAMQFIDGQSLAELIARRVAPGSGDPTTPHVPALSEADTTPHAADTTGPAPRDKAFFRRAAEWAAQAAEALEHAHSVGVVHRDIKPANLLIDGAGKLWVADFGLARTAADTGLTMSGDVLGTLRYMSPEQALAKHGLVDHRTDIYSLGATLYELLTGRAAVEGKDRGELFHNLAFGAPPAPRSLERGVPVDLETVALKCLEKDPTDRYGSARELGDDLRCFLEDRPVRARRPGLLDRAGRWARRHRGAIVGAFALLLLAVAGLTAGLLVVRQERDEKGQALGERNDALAAETAALAQARRNFDEVTRQKQRAEDYLGEAAKMNRVAQELAQVHEEAGRLGRAAEVLRNSLELNQTLLNAYPARGEHRLAVTQGSRALAGRLRMCGEFREAVRAMAVYLANYERFLVDEKSPTGWAKVLGTIHRDFEQVEGWRYMGYLHHRAGDHPAARAAYRLALANYRRIEAKPPENFLAFHIPRVEALVGLGEVEAELGEGAEARRCFGEVIRLTESKGVDLWLGRRFGAKAHIGLGTLSLAEGKPVAARESFTRARDLLAKEVNSLLRVMFLANCPDPAFRDAKLAMKLGEELVKRGPNDPDCWRALGLARLRAGDDTAGEALGRIFRLGVKFEPTDYFFQAMVLHRRRQPAGARKALDAGVAKMKDYNPKDLVALRMRDEAAAELGQPGGPPPKVP